MAFTDELHPVVSPIFEEINHHPMVAGIGDGTLDAAPFEYWVKQDYVYLIEYARVFALGAAKGPGLSEMGRFAELLDGILNTEMDLHRSYAAEFGIAEAELEGTTASPTTQAYTDFLVRTAAVGTFGDTVAALLPCMWGFNETGKHLSATGLPDHDQYAAWIEMYAGEEFTELTEWCLDLMNGVAVDATEDDRSRFRSLVETSALYEYLFWDAAWREEAWPVERQAGSP